MTTFMKHPTHRATPRSSAVALPFMTVLALGAGCATTPARPHARAFALQAAGVDALARGQLESAAGHFALALEYDPHLAEAESGLGLVALRRGDLARAEEDFRAALALNEDLAEAHVNLADLLMRRGDDAERARRGARCAGDRSGLRRRAPAGRRAPPASRTDERRALGAGEAVRGLSAPRRRARRERAGAGPPGPPGRRRGAGRPRAGDRSRSAGGAPGARRDPSRGPASSRRRPARSSWRSPRTPARSKIGWPAPRSSRRAACGTKRRARSRIWSPRRPGNRRSVS